MISSGHPTSSPLAEINHEHAPTNRSHHSHPSPKSAHATPGHSFKPTLQDHSDAHEDEEAADSAELGSPPEPPHLKVMYNRGRAERAREVSASELPRRPPKTTNMCRKNWCQRNLQKSTIEVDIHGRLKGGGHFQAGCRGMRRPMSDAMW